MLLTRDIICNWKTQNVIIEPSPRSFNSPRPETRDMLHDHNQDAIPNFPPAVSTVHMQLYFVVGRAKYVGASMPDYCI